MTPIPDALPPLEQQIDEYIDGYTLEGDDGYYQPNDTERFIAKDVVMGLLAEPWFVAALAAAPQGAQVPQGRDAVGVLRQIAARLEEAGRPQAANGVRLAILQLEQASPQAPAQREHRVECDACPTSLGCLDKCIKAAAPAAQADPPDFGEVWKVLVRYGVPVPGRREVQELWARAVAKQEQPKV